MGKVEADIQEILHEWHTPKAVRILKEMGVSERNWKLFALHRGVANGEERGVGQGSSNSQLP